jgi:TDG/mug DNA glycosylase family protein
MKTSDSEPVLPDLLQDGLRLVFCGTAPGTVSAARKQYYAHPRNKFWRILFETGLTPRRFEPAEYPELLGLGIGLTDIAKHVSGVDNALPRGSLGREAIQDLRDRIGRFQPGILAFTSLTGGRRFLGSDAAVGRRKAKVGSTQIWVLPSPSPAADWNWDAQPWHALARAARAS